MLSLSGTNTYSGPTIVSAGTLQLLQHPAALPAGTKIMPVGDSITYGADGTNAGYRGFLYNDLTAAGNTFQFVGTTNGNPGSLPTAPSTRPITTAGAAGRRATSPAPTWTPMSTTAPAATSAPG